MASFSVSDTSAVDAIRDRIEDAVRPVVEGLNGWQGATQLLDRKGGKLVVIHFFDTEANMEAAEPTFEGMPGRFDESLRADLQRVARGRQSVDKFEVTGEFSRSA